jgi:hypothetical protein
MEEKSPVTNCQIEEIKEALDVIKNEQTNLSENLQKNFSVIMSKLMKMQEYNKIADMTNQVFEMRMSNIEDLLLKIGAKL